jgi:hypothetical protein
MSPQYILLSLTILLFSACQKKGNVVPAPKNTTDSATVKTDSSRQLPAFVSFTDTFYGFFAAQYMPGYIYVYVSHPSANSVIFSANDNHNIEYYGGFNKCFTLKSSNYISCGDTKNSESYYHFIILHDSLFYNGSAETCSDSHAAGFVGVKIK